MKIKIFIVFFLLSGIIIADISPQSAKLEKLRMQIVKAPTKANICAYLNAFPSTFKEFKFIFYGQKNIFDELYDKHQEHLFLLWELSKKYPKKVLSIWLSIAKNGYWDADAIGMLQQQLAKYASMNTKTFALNLLKKGRNERKGIIKFIADKHAHNIYFYYITLLKNLKRLKFNKLYEEFLKAKKERMKHYHG